MKNILGAYLLPHPPIIIEEIGRGEETKAKDTIKGVKEISKDIKTKAPSTIVLITPHGPMFSDAIAISGEEKLKGSFKNFGQANLKYEFKNNIELVDKIMEKSLKKDIITVKIDKSNIYNVDTDLDHGSLVPLHFINKEYKNFKLVHITYGQLAPKDLYRFGKIIKESIIDLNEKAIVIASGDLSHKLSTSGPYEYSPYGEKFDKKVMEIIKNKELKKLITFDLNLAEKAGECALRSLMIMTGTLDRFNIDTKVLSYEGPFGVGYGTAIIDIVGENNMDTLKEIEKEINIKIGKLRKKESSYVELARKTLEHYVKTGEILELDKESNVQKAVFVTLKKNGILRGCIGTTEPTTDSIEKEILRNSVSAGTKDPRFSPVVEDELKALTYSVDVLSEAEAIESLDDLDVEKYGVIVESGYKKGLLLPNLDGIDTVEEQVQIALDKAGIKANEDYKIERFKVERYY